MSNIYPWWLAEIDIRHSTFDYQHVFHWICSLIVFLAFQSIVLLLRLNFKGNGGSRVTVGHWSGARHQHSRLSIPYYMVRW